MDLVYFIEWEIVNNNRNCIISENSLLKILILGINENVLPFSSFDHVLKTKMSIKNWYRTSFLIISSQKTYRQILKMCQNEILK